MESGSMKATVQRLDVLHELSFQPAFVLARNASETLQNFYTIIAPRYAIPVEHVAVNAANILSEWFIRIGLFENLAALELRINKMTLRFPQSQAAEGVKAVKDVTMLAHDALRKAVPDVRSAQTAFSLSSWMALEGGTDAAQAFLRKRAMPQSCIDPKQLGGENATYVLRVNVPNPTEMWTVQITAEPSALPQADLFLLVQLSFGHGTQYQGVDEQILFTERLVRKVLASLEIDLMQTGS
jgi:hypothetical protein